MKRKTAREKNADKASERKDAMLAVIGLWKDRTDLPDTDSYVRSLRTDDRTKRVLKKATIGADARHASDVNRRSHTIV